MVLPRTTAYQVESVNYLLGPRGRQGFWHCWKLHHCNQRSMSSRSCPSQMISSRGNRQTFAESYQTRSKELPKCTHSRHDSFRAELKKREHLTIITPLKIHPLGRISVRLRLIPSSCPPLDALHLGRSCKPCRALPARVFRRVPNKLHDQLQG